MMSQKSFQKVALILTLTGLAGCGQNPAVKVASGQASKVSDSNRNAILKPIPAPMATPDAAVKVAATLAEGGSGPYYSESDAEAFSEKDENEVGSDFPYLNKDQGELASRPIGFPPRMTNKGNGYAMRSNIYFRIAAHLPPRASVKRIEEATLEFTVRKHVKSDGDTTRLGAAIFCLLDNKTCSGALDDEKANQSESFFKKMQIVHDDFSQIALKRQVALLESGTRLMDTEKQIIPLERLFKVNDLKELLYEKSGATVDSSVRKLRFVMANNVMPLSVTLHLRFEVDGVKANEVKMYVKADPTDDPRYSRMDQEPICPPVSVVVNVEPSKPVIVEKIVEKPVEKIVEKIVEKPVEKIVEKPAPQVVKLKLDSRAAQFDTNSANIKGPSKKKLEQLADLVKTLDFDVVHVVGHTDKTGQDDYNMKLSEQRAESVRKIFLDKGILPSKITSEGMGKNQPLKEAPGNTPADYAKNRRVEIEVKGMTNPEQVAAVKKKIEELWKLEEPAKPAAKPAAAKPTAKPAAAKPAAKPAAKK